jgi:Helix-turn-helix.
MNDQFMTLIDLVSNLQALTYGMGSQKDLAKDIGISPQYLHDILTGRREPGEKVCEYLGVERTVIYKVIPQPESEER